MQVTRVFGLNMFENLAGPSLRTPCQIGLRNQTAWQAVETMVAETTTA